MLVLVRKRVAMVVAVPGKYNMHVVLRHSGSADVNLNGGNAVPIDGANFDLRIEPKRMNRVAKQFAVDAEVNQCAEEHVAADTGEAVEVSNAHGKTVVGRASCATMISEVRF